MLQASTGGTNTHENKPCETAVPLPRHHDAPRPLPSTPSTSMPSRVHVHCAPGGRALQMPPPPHLVLFANENAEVESETKKTREKLSENYASSISITFNVHIGECATVKLTLAYHACFPRTKPAISLPTTQATSVHVPCVRVRVRSVFDSLQMKPNIHNKMQART